MKKNLIALATAALMVTGAQARTLVINTDDQNPAPKEAFTYAVDTLKRSIPILTSSGTTSTVKVTKPVSVTS